jgi:ubiquinone biosynthesis protein COQ9
MTSIEKKKILNFLLKKKSTFSFAQIKELEIINKNKNFRYMDDKEISLVMILFYFEENRKKLASQNIAIKKIKSTTLKIKYFLHFQLELDLKNKEFVKKVFLFLFSEKNISKILDYFFSTSSTMWNLSGDTATDFNYYSKRLILCSIYSKIFIKLLNLPSYSKNLILQDIEKSLDQVKQFNIIKSKICSNDILSIFKNFNFNTKEQGRGF